jgi:hypothetical protein
VTIEVDILFIHLIKLIVKLIIERKRELDLQKQKDDQERKKQMDFERQIERQRQIEQHKDEERKKLFDQREVQFEFSFYHTPSFHLRLHEKKWNVKAVWNGNGNVCKNYLHKNLVYSNK